MRRFGRLAGTILFAVMVAFPVAAGTGDPLLVYYRPESCGRNDPPDTDPCRMFEDAVLSHPEIVERLRGIELESRLFPSTNVPPEWPFDADTPGFALFRSDGRLVARWPGLPSSFEFGMRLLGIQDASPRLFVAAEQEAEGWHLDAELLTAYLSGLLDDPTRGAEALDALWETGLRPAQQELVVVLGQLLLEKEEDGHGSLDVLEETIANGLTPAARENARVVKGIILESRGETTAALVAYADTLRIARPGSFAHQVLMDFVVIERPKEIRVAPLEGVLSGSVLLNAIPGSASIASVDFFLDDDRIGRDGEPPFEMLARLERIPKPHTIKVRGLDQKKRIIDEDSLVVNVPEDSVATQFDEPKRSVAARPKGELQQVPEMGLHEIPVILAGGKPPIERSDIHLIEDGIERPVEAIRLGADVGLTIGLVLDASEGVLPELLDVQHAAIRFLGDVAREGDRGYLVTFDETARLVCPPSPDLARIIREIRRIQPSGRTALYDGLVLGLAQMQGLSGRRALVVVADGNDVSSGYGLPDVYRVARAVATPMYLILASQEGDANLHDRENRARLEMTVRNTGGRVVRLESPEQLPEALEEIAREVRSQVILSFPSRAPDSPKWRSIAVRSNRDDLEIRAPEGYFALPN